MSTVAVTQVSKSYGHNEVLREVSLHVENKSITAVVGSSGSGKTTLLRVVAGFEHPDAGAVRIGDDYVARDRRSVAPNRRGIGYVAQDGALFPHLTVGRNIGYGLRGRSGRKQRIAELLELVALDPSFADRRPHQLSGGQQQRIALARALAREPKVLLLDEPFSALDAGLRVATRKSVAATLRDAGVTSILVTHDQEEALSFADQVAVMREGSFTQVGSPEAVYSTPADLFTAEFVGDSILLDAMVAGDVADCALGRVKVRGSGPSGPATVMLRPEQLVATPAAADDHGVGVVVAAEFLGSDVVSTIALTGHPDPIAVRHPNIDVPAVGTRVGIRVHGEAMCYERRQ